MGILHDSAAHARDQSNPRPVGADGWELVQVIPGPTGSENLVAYLKRPIEEAPAVQN